MNIHPLQIGDVKIPNNLILAPMAGVSDLPFRLLCQEAGAGMTCTEMVSAKAIYFQNKNTQPLLAMAPQERAVSLQLFGSDPQLMAEIAQRIEPLPFSVLDLNMGCPVPKIVNNGDGSALMRDPQKAGEVIRAVSRAIKKPVTVKMRLGFDEQSINVLEFAKIAQENGAAAVAVHGRTRSQYYSGKADWTWIARVKEELSIPVLGNGDVFTAQDAVRMLRETGCDGVLIARGARGNPWLFDEILEYARTGAVPLRPGREEISRMILRHARMQADFRGEKIAMREMRKHVAWYTNGLPHSAWLRRRVNQVETLNQLEELLLSAWTNMLTTVSERSDADGTQS